MMKGNQFRKIILFLLTIIIATYNYSFNYTAEASAYTPMWVVKPIYERLDMPYNDDMSFIVYKVIGKESYGFMDLNGKIKTKAEYEEIRRLGDIKRLFIKKNGKWGMMDYTGKILLQPIYDIEITSYYTSDSLIPIRKDGKTAIVDINGKIVVNFVKCQELSEPYEGLVAFMDDKGKCGFVNTSGKVVIPAQYQWVGDFSEGLAPVYINKAYGYIDKTGKVVIPAQYHTVSNFQGGLATVSRIYDEISYERHSAVIDKQGKIVIPFSKKYNYISRFNEYGLAAFMIKRGEYSDAYIGFVDKNGKEIIPKQAELESPGGLDFYVDDFNKDGLIVMGSNRSGWAVYHYTGKKILDESIAAAKSGMRFEKCYGEIIDGGLAVYSTGQWYLIDLEGNLVSKESYSRIAVNVGGEIQVTADRNGLEYWGIADYKFNIKYPTISREIVQKITPKVYVSYIDGYQFTDEKGNELDPNKMYAGLAYTGIGENLYGVELMNRDGGGYSFVDLNTGKLTPVGKYEYIKGFSKGLAPVCIKGKWGYIDKNGKMVIPTIFDEVEAASKTLLPVKLNGKWGLIQNPLSLPSSHIKAVNIARLSGSNRYETAVSISKSGWTKTDNIILVNGSNFPDALVGSSLAFLKDAPMLITSPNKLESSTAAEINRLGAKTIYILGNSASVSKAVENTLKQKYNVIRIGGTEIFDTAVKVGEEVRKIKQFDTVGIATQSNFPDALALAPFSARNTMPILFSGKDKLRDDTRKALREWGIKNVIISGGTGVISATVENEISAMGIAVIRLAGQDRYDTALEVIKHFETDGGYTNISVCTGQDYPDALTGAVLAAKNNTPLVLVSKSSVKDSMTQYLKKKPINKAYIFGGVGVVSDWIVGK
jgi:putative cell wall-binding protein